MKAPSPLSAIQKLRASRCKWVTHAGNPGANSAAGTMQHLALKVKDHDEMMAMRDRLRAKGVPVLGPMDHGMCVSMYFAGPENLSLELSYSSQPINNAQWIDPEVVALAGISKEELERYKNPAAFPGSGGSVAQPAIGETSTGPHMTNYPPGRYEASTSVPDEVVLTMVESEPPVPPKRLEIPAQRRYTRSPPPWVSDWPVGMTPTVMGANSSPLPPVEPIQPSCMFGFDPHRRRTAFAADCCCREGW